MPGAKMVGSAASGRMRKLTILGGVLIGMSMPTVASGDVGTYVQYACHLPDGGQAPTDSITGTAGGLGSVADTCSAGGGLTITLPTTTEAHEASGTWTFAVPPETTVARVGYTRVVRGVASNTDESTRVYQGPVSDRCGWYGLCPETRTLDAAPTGSAISFQAYCEYAPCHGAEPGDGFVSIDKIAITLEDDHLPTFVGQPSGSLFDKNTLTGIANAAFTAADQGGGVYEAALVVDGVEQPRTTVDTNGGACAKPFVKAVPCKLQADGSLSLDTSKLDDGPHNVSVVVYDATDTNSVAFGPVPVEVDNVPDPPTTGSGAQGGGQVAQPTAKLVAISRPTRLSFARAGSARGKLVDEQGQPIGSSVLDIYESVDVPNAPVHLVGQTTTGADGTFRFAIAKGPSRRFTVRDRNTGATWTFTVTVPAPLRLSASRKHLDNGQKLMLTAYLAGEKVPAKSAAVAFQVLIGHQWRTFATRDIRADGSTRVSHRFKVTFQRLTYRFRAVVVGRKPFPFANATSNQATVQVN